MRKKQSGAILVISLILLLALTLFVISGSQTVVVQEKMTAAVRDMHVSLEIAESGISDAEAVIEAFASASAVDSAFTSGGTNGLYSLGNGPSDLFAAATWATGITAAATTNVAGLGTGVVARYFIEDMGLISVSNTTSTVVISGYGTTASSDDLRLFKVVSRSLGNNGNTERVVVSYYGKNF